MKCLRPPVTLDVTAATATSRKRQRVIPRQALQPRLTRLAVTQGVAVHDRNPQDSGLENGAPKKAETRDGQKKHA